MLDLDQTALTLRSLADGCQNLIQDPGLPRLRELIRRRSVAEVSREPVRDCRLDGPNPSDGSPHDSVRFYA